MPSTSSLPEAHKHTLVWKQDATSWSPGYACQGCDWLFADFRAEELVKEGKAVMAEPKDTLPRGGAEGVHVHEWGEWKPDRLMRIEYASCDCGASKARRAELEKPQEPVCTHCQGPHALEDCKGLEEPEEDPYKGLAGNCGTCGATGTDAEPEEGVCVCGHPEGDHRAGLSHPHSGCNWCTKEQCGGYRTEADAERCCSCGSADVVYRNYREQDFCRHCADCTCGHVPCERKPADIPRRPPYAVAYAVEGGAQYEVAVSGDATVVAEDGVLMVLHPKKPVLAIVRVAPMHVEETPNG